MLNIYFGRESLDKEKFIFENLSGRNIILVPDQYTLEAERAAFRHLGVSALMDVEVLSPSRLGSRVLAYTGGGRRPYIDKYGRHMLLYRSARRLADRLQVFKGLEKKNSFLAAVNDFISEMKQYDCGPCDLQNAMAQCEEGSYTQRKLADICLLFTDYEEQIKGKYTDAEDHAGLYVERLRDYRPLRESSVWVYGFDSFAPKALALMGQLAQTAQQLNIVMTYDDNRRDEELFALPGLVIENLEALAEKLGVEHKRCRIPESYGWEKKAEAVRHIERELYALPARNSSRAEGLTLTAAANVYSEAESAAAYILHLVRDEGLRYRDIKVICNDMDSRGEAAARVFEEYGLPLAADSKKNIMANAIVRTVTSLLGVVIEKYRTQSLLDLLKSGFGDLNSEELADLENYAIKYKIRGSMWKKPFSRGLGEYGAEGLAAVEALRERAVCGLAPLEELFKTEKTGDFISGFYAYLKDTLRLPEKIADFAAGQLAGGLHEAAAETEQIWESLLTILEQMYEIMGEDEFVPQEFYDIFCAGLGEIEIGLIPQTEDALLMGTIQRSRSGSIRALVVLGANEGVLPQEKPTQGIFSPEERELLASSGKEMCKVDAVRFMEEKVAIYRNLSAPGEYLWVSYSATDTDGSQLRPSRLFTKLSALFPKLPVQSDVISSGRVRELINPHTSGLRHLTEALRAAGEGVTPDSDWLQTLAWLGQKKPQAAAALRRGLAFTNRQEELGQEAADALFRKDTQAALALSPSRIEKYARCPFSHLVAYGLRPEERRVFEAAPREIGDIYHQCLLELTRALSREGTAVTDPASPWMTITRAECDALVEEKITAIAGAYRDGLFNDGSVEEYRRQRALAICRQVCWSAVEQVRAGQIAAISPEAAFGRRGVLPPLVIELKDRSVLIEGIIDRVDQLSDGRIKIIDYKTGNESFDVAEAACGYRLQLMLYLQAACGSERKPAGVFYFRIRDPIVDFSHQELDEEKLENEIRKAFKLDGVMIDDPQVIHDIAGDFTGFSQIVPLKKTKEGIKSTGREGLMAEEDFEKLRQAVAARVRQACEDLTAGRIDIHPMKTKDRSACTYCDYKGICRFDTVFEGCSYNIVR